jgi:hypothetical protein
VVNKTIKVRGSVICTHLIMPTEEKMVRSSSYRMMLVENSACCQVSTMGSLNPYRKRHDTYGNKDARQERDKCDEGAFGEAVGHKF